LDPETPLWSGSLFYCCCSDVLFCGYPVDTAPHPRFTSPFCPSWFAGSFCFYLALLFVRLIKTKCQELLLPFAFSSGCFRSFFAAVSRKQMKFLQGKEYKTWRLDFFLVLCVCYFFLFFVSREWVDLGKSGAWLS